VFLASCGSNVSEIASLGDPDATKVAESQYSVCLAESAARLDDGRSEAAAIGNAVAGACYPQFVRMQIADGDEAREAWLTEHSEEGAVLMHQQDLVQQTHLATQAVLAYRRRSP
jgi:hypothetical protein